MKIENGSPNQLIEQMHQAHAARKKEHVDRGHVLSSDAPSTIEALPSIDRALLGLAQKVLDGQLDDPIALRSMVIDVIVDEKYGALVAPDKKETTLSVLHYTLSDDPQFSQQVDMMLVMAAQQLADLS